LVLDLRKRFSRTGAAIRPAIVNGEPASCLRTHGQLTGVLAIESDGERILEVYAIVNE
jgi:hypothetical protein